MSIQVHTTSPQELLDSIYEAIDEGNIETWSYDEDGDFSHDTSSEQWSGEAWLHPEVTLGILLLTIVPPQDGLSKEAYAVYHGRFIEMLLAHFDDEFSIATTTAME